MKTALAAAAAAGVLILALAGCSSAPSAAPHSAKPLTAAQKCTPASAKVQWPPAASDDGSSTKNFVPVRVQVFDDRKGAALGTEKDIDIAPKTTVVYPDEPAYNWSSSSPQAWLAALTEDARLSGQVFPGYDRAKNLPDIKTAGDFHSGVHIVVSEIERITVPFSILCTGQRAIGGQISGVNNRAIIPEVITCGSTRAESRAQDVRTRALALAPKYCPPATS